MEHSESNSSLKKSNLRIAIAMGTIAIISALVPFAALID
jgi:hypothetical protein